MQELEQIVEENQVDIVAITESWLSESTPLGLVSLRGFKLIQKSRDQRIGGGVILYINDDFDILEHEDLSSEDNIWCSLKTGNESLLVGLVYRAPSSSPENNSKINDSIRKASRKSGKSLLILGDFNFPQIDWERRTSAGTEPTRFLDTVDECYLIQHVNFDTREGGNDESSLLDLVITKDYDVERLTKIAPLGLSDHSCIMFDYILREARCDIAEQDPKPDFFKGDYNSIRSELSSIQWKNTVQSLNNQNVQ